MNDFFIDLSSPFALLNPIIEYLIRKFKQCSILPEISLAFGIPALRIISVSFVFASITILCGYFASGLGNGIINMVAGAIRQLVLLVPFLWFFATTFGIQYAWFAFWIAEIAAFLYSYTTTHHLLKKFMS